MAHLKCNNKRPVRSRLDEPFVCRVAFLWNGKQYKPGYKIPKEMRESRASRLRWWERRKIVPVADVISGLRHKPKKKEEDAPPANTQPEPPANTPANEGDGNGDNEGATANPQPDAGDGDNGDGDQGSQSE